MVFNAGGVVPEIITNPSVNSNESVIKRVPAAVADVMVAFTDAVFKTKDFIYKPQEQDKFTERVKSAFSNGWSMLVNLIIGLFGIWPWLILFYIAYRIIKKLIKNKPTAK